MGDTRKKKLMKSVESIKKQIEIHFKKLEEDFKNNNFDFARYHVKELDKSLIDSLKKRLEMLGENDDIVKKYEERLRKLMDGFFEK